MNNMDKEINTLLMQEIGLEIGNGNKIVDQDSGATVSIGGKNIIAPGTYGGPNSIEFDNNNRKMMGLLFGYFLNKHSEESDVEVLTYYNVEKDNNKSCIECRLSDQTSISSKAYSKDSLKYADIMIQLNGDECPDLKMYDSEETKSAIKKRGNSNARKNKSNAKTAKSSR